MKRWILALALLVCAVPASAGGFSMFATYMDTDDANDEEGLGLKLEFNTGKHADLQLRAAIYEDLETEPEPNVYQIQATPIDFGFNWDFGDPTQTANAYVGLGISYWVLDFSTDTDLSGDPPLPPPPPQRGVDIDPESGWYVEVGVDIAMHDGPWSFFGEVVWRDVSTEVEGDDLGLATDQQVGLSGFALNVGATINWDFGVGVEGSGGRY